MTMATSKVNANISVIESGTDGVWTYRKWSDGTAECWGQVTKSGTWRAWGSSTLYELTQTTYTHDYPSGLFSETPVCIATFEGNGTGGMIEAYGGGSKDHTVGLVIVRTSAPSVKTGFKVNIYARGKWN